jgi:hypothetical protein
MNKRRAWTLSVAALLILAAVMFSYKDAKRIAYPVNDFTTPWVAATALLHGKNPYNDTQEFARIWASTRASMRPGLSDYNQILADLPMAYPPTALMLLSPLGLLPFPAALGVYTVCSVVFFVAMLFLLARRLGASWRDPKRQFFFAFALAMAPLHMGVQVVNMNAAAVGCIFAALALRKQKPYVAGVAMAVAMCLKPQIAFLFFAYFWLKRYWKTAWTSLAASAGVFLGAELWMKLHGIDWLPAYFDAMKYYSATDGLNSYFSSSLDGLAKYHLLNLQVLVYVWSGSRKLADPMSWAAFACLAAIAAYLIRRRIPEKNESAGWAMVAILTLLPVCQHFYGAEILALVVFWAMENWNLKTARVALGLMLPLLLPLVPWLATYVQVDFSHYTHFTITDRIAATVENLLQTNQWNSNWIWYGVLLPHVIWIEIFLLLLLYFTVYRRATNRDISSNPS